MLYHSPSSNSLHLVQLCISLAYLGWANSSMLASRPASRPAKFLKNDCPDPPTWRHFLKKLARRLAGQSPHADGSIVGQ